MDNNTGCPVKAYLCKLICLSIAVFVFLFAAGYVVHHIWLMPIYQRTAALWRPADQMEILFPWLIGYYAVLALLLSALFLKCKKAKMVACGTPPADDPECKIGGKKCPIKFGICFGAIVGLLLGVTKAAAWIFQPIPSDLAIKWLFAWTIEGIGAGIIMSAICYCKQNRCAINK